jgi:hypothetical protein
MSDSKLCPHAYSCEMYTRFTLKGALRIWQKRYCEDPVQQLKCARYERSKAGQPVPSTLLPNGESIPT